MIQGTRPVTYISWFCGIGGFDLAFDRVGFACVASCELADFPRSVFAARFGAPPTWEDIRNVDPKEIPPAELWCGGFPCQDVSSAGKRGGIAAGKRTGLIWTLLDLWDAVPADHAPEWLLLENVPGLLSGSNEGADGAAEGGGLGEPAEDLTWMGIILGALADRGLRWAYRVLDARYFGVPQRRRRVFILARRSRDGAHPGEILLEPEGRRGHPAARGATRPRTAEGAGRGAGVVGALGGASERAGWRFGGDEAAAGHVIASAVTASAGHPGHSSPRGDGSDNLVVAPITTDPYADNAAQESQLVVVASADGCEFVAYPIDSRQAARGDKDTNDRTDGGAPGAGIGEANDPGYTVSERGQAVAYHVNAAGSCAKKDHAFESDHARSLDTTGGFASGQGGALVGFNAKSESGKGGNGAADNIAPPIRETNPVAIAGGGMAVRRLTPRECERLQGFPDDWTAIPCATDGARYKALGNAVAVPVVEWIARRLGQVVA